MAAKKRPVHQHIDSFMLSRLKVATKAQRLELARDLGLIVTNGDRVAWEGKDPQHQAAEILTVFRNSVRRQSERAQVQPPIPPMREVRVHVLRANGEIVVSLDGMVVLTMKDGPQEVATHHKLSGYIGPPLPTPCGPGSFPPRR